MSLCCNKTCLGPIIMQIFRPFGAVDFPSHHSQTDTDTAKQSFVIIDKVYLMAVRKVKRLINYTLNTIILHAISQAIP